MAEAPAKAPTVGYVGLGDMGAPVAHRILAAGYPLVVLNRTRAKMQPFVDAGAEPADDPADMAARCDIVLLCLDTPQAVEDVSFGANGLSSATDRRLAQVVDNSTLHPSTAADLARRARDAGFAYLDAPVTGGSRGAREGRLVVMIGGDAPDVEAVRPVVMTFAQRLSHMGPAGCGMAAKICNQMLLFSSMLASAEMLAMARRFGLDPPALLAAIADGAGDSVLMRNYARALAEGRHVSGTGLIDRIAALYAQPDGLARADASRPAFKDVEIARDLGRAGGTPTPLMDHFARVMSAL